MNLSAPRLSIYEQELALHGAPVRYTALIVNLQTYQLKDLHDEMCNEWHSLLLFVSLTTYRHVTIFSFEGEEQRLAR